MTSGIPAALDGFVSRGLRVLWVEHRRADLLPRLAEAEAHVRRRRSAWLFWRRSSAERVVHESGGMLLFGIGNHGSCRGLHADALVMSPAVAARPDLVRELAPVVAFSRLERALYVSEPS